MARYYEITAGADQVYFGRCSMAFAISRARDAAVTKAKPVTIWRAQHPRVSRHREPMITITPESALSGKKSLDG